MRLDQLGFRVSGLGDLEGLGLLHVRILADLSCCVGAFGGFCVLDLVVRVSKVTWLSWHHAFYHKTRFF